MSLRTIFACSFKAELTLEQILARFNEVGPWTWTMRDSHWYGDYLWVRALPVASIKIYEEPHHYVVQVKFESDNADASAELEALRATVFGKVLPGINARDLTSTETYD